MCKNLICLNWILKRLEIDSRQVTETKIVGECPVYVLFLDILEFIHRITRSRAVELSGSEGVQHKFRNAD